VKKRLRKKKRVGEFAIQGIVFEGVFVSVDDTFENVFIDRLIEFVETFGMSCGGGSNSETFGFIVSGYRYDPNRRGGRGGYYPVSTTEAEWKAVATWLSVQPDVKSFTIGRTDLYGGGSE